MNSTIEMIPTNTLWDRAHRALCAKEWTTARYYLDRLHLRSDNADRFPSAAAYGLPEDHGYHDVIQHRIDVVNDRAKRSS